MRAINPSARLRLSFGVAAALFTHASLAQQADRPAPQIVVSGNAEIFVPPAKAAFSIGISTVGVSAAAAASDNARISQAVAQALAAAGLEREELIGSQLSVSPRWEYDDKTHRSKRTGFEASNTLQIETERLAGIGGDIDAALSAGATDASQIRYSAKDIEELRRRALTQAVSAARADAQAMALAGGGSLGELLLLSTERSSEMPGVELQEVVVTGRSAAAVPINSSITPSQIQVSARVIAHWRFVPNAAAR